MIFFIRFFYILLLF